MKRLLTSVMMLIPAAAVAAIAAPYLLMLLSTPFPRPVVVAYLVLFSVAALERTWSMFSRIRMRDYMELRNDWTAAGVGVSYVAVYYVTLFEFFGRGGIGSPVVSALGICGYLGAVLLRYWSFHHLTHQWAVHVDKAGSNRSLVQSGPYRWVRHPLYAGSCLEALALPLAFNAWTALAVSVLLYVPLEIYRAYFEERYLLSIFGNDYGRYAARTWAFVPLPFGKSSD